MHLVLEKKKERSSQNISPTQAPSRTTEYGDSPALRASGPKQRECHYGQSKAPEGCHVKCRCSKFRKIDHLINLHQRGRRKKWIDMESIISRAVAHGVYRLPSSFPHRRMGLLFQRFQSDTSSAFFSFNFIPSAPVGGVGWQF